MRWWYRIMLAAPVIGIVNLSLLSISVAPILADYTGIRRVWLIVCLPVLAVGCLAVLGYALDKCRWAQRGEWESVNRSPATWGRLFDQLDRIERR